MKKPAAEVVVPAIVDLVFVAGLMLAFNLIGWGLLGYAGILFEEFNLGVGFWRLMPVTFGIFAMALILRMAAEIRDSPSRIPDHRPCNDKEEENDDQ